MCPQVFWNRFKVSEKLGVTAAIPVAPVDTFLTIECTTILLNQSLGERGVQKVHKCAYVIYEWYLCKLAKDGVDAWTPPTLREGPKIYSEK